MRTRKLILLLAVVALSVALVSVLSACGGDGDTTTPAATTTAGDTVTTTAQAGDVTTAATTTAPVVTTTAAPTSFNATFKDEDGTVIATVRFRVGDTALTEPALPTKAGYLAEWSKYRLGSSDIEVTVIYTSIAEGSQGLEFVKKADLSGYIVTGYNGSNRAVAIPATYKAEEDAVALPVVEIATIAFRGEDIVSLYIPESVVTIGDNAFAQCDSLKTVELPAGLTALGNYAFFSCDSLESVTFPASLTKISSYAFAQCVSLKNLTFKTATVEDVTVGLANIATDAFSGCSSIETLILPDTMAASGNTTSIGAAAFLGCTGLKTLVLPSGLTTLVADTFLGCNAIETLTANAGVLPYIPNTSLTTVTLTGGATLAPSAFKGADRLTTLHLPASLTTLPAGRLDDCLSLTTITVDAANTFFSVRADGALYYAKDGEVKLVRVPLTKAGSFTVPADVTTIEGSAFAGCDKLTSITIGAAVTKIADKAFYGIGASYVVIPATVTTLEGTLFDSEDMLVFCEAAASAYSTGFGIATTYYEGEWTLVDGVPTPNAD